MRYEKMRRAFLSISIIKTQDSNELMGSWAHNPRFNRGLSAHRSIVLLKCLVSSLLILLAMSACESPLFQNLFKEQEWSENYVLADGVRCTAPEMIDGDVNTAGKTLFPEKVHGRVIYGAFPSAEAEIILPEKKSIRKIVIRSEDLSTFDVLASIGVRGDWKLIEEFDNNKEKEIVIRASVVTDKIKIRARGKSSFDGTERGIVHGGVMTMRSTTVTEPEIQEIELYGFK